MQLTPKLLALHARRPVGLPDDHPDMIAWSTEWDETFWAEAEKERRLAELIIAHSEHVQPGTYRVVPNVIHARPNTTIRPIYGSTTRNRRTRRTTTRTASRGSDPPQPPHKPAAGFPPPAADVATPRDSDLNIVWAEARNRFETVREYETLASLCEIRAAWLANRGWAA